MGLEQLHLEGVDKVQFSIDLIQANEPANEPYYLADSGGKDSRALRMLCDLAKVKYIAHYHTNPLDPPEVPQFLKANFPDTIFERTPVPYWKAFAMKGFPLRNARWCCEYIKEWGGAGQSVLLGVRSEESEGRKHRCFLAYNEKGRTRWDRKTTRNIISPMLLWTQKDVWSFLERYKVPYLSLYDEGSSGPYKGDGKIQRVGCVMCPCATDGERLEEYARYPKVAGIWYRAFQRLWENGRLCKDGKSKDPDNYKRQFPSADAMFWWWMAPPRNKKRQKTMKMAGF